MTDVDVRFAAVPRNTSVGIWIRVSTVDQANGESPEHHETRARHYAESKGWKVSRVYDLSAVSGKSVLGHPEAMAMLEDVRTKKIRGLIFSKLARLARNTKELLELSEVFSRHGAAMVSLGESIDTSTPMGRYFYTNLAALAQWEREETVDRVKASVKTRAKAGKSLGGAAPYGYRWEDKRLVIEPDEAAIRKELFDLFARERRVKTVSRLLNEKGYRTRRGAKWSGTTVRRLLSDPIAKGMRIVNSTESTGDGKQWVRKPKEEWIEIETPQIVSDALWEECNAILGARKHTTRKPGKKAVHLFAGVAFCTCGEKMYVPSHSKKYTCVSCRNKIPTDTLETVFQHELETFVSSPDDVLAAFDEQAKDLATQERRRKTLAREKEKLQRRMDKLYELYQGDHISSRDFGERHWPLEERMEQLSNEIPRVQAEIDVLTMQHVSSEELAHSAAELYQRWADLPFPERRAIVEAIVSKITVGQSKVEILLINPQIPIPTHPNAAKREHMPRGSSTPARRSGRGSRTEPGFSPR